MNNTFLNKVFSFIMLSIGVFVVYCFSIVIGENIAIYLGFREKSLYQFVISIFLSSCLAFMLTLVINYIYNLVPVFIDEQFLRIYHGIHLLFLYISGLVAALTTMEPMLIKEKIIMVPFQNEIMSISVLIFFIILSNYSIYNSVVINNELKLNIKKKNSQHISLNFIFTSLGVILSFILIVMMIYNKFDDMKTIILFAIINIPYFLNMFSIKSKSLEN